MKILHTNFLNGWGGQSNRVLTECVGLVGFGHEVVVAAPPGSQLALRAKAAGVETWEGARFPRGFRPWLQWREVARLRRFIAGRGFDLIHTHGSQDSWAVAAALIGTRSRPTIIRGRHNVFPIAPHAFNRWLYGRVTDAFVCVSQAALDELRAFPWLADKPAAVISSGFRGERFRPSGEEGLRSDVGAAPGDWVIGCVGRLREEKGHRYMIEAMPEILKSVPGALLVLCGSGSLEGELKGLAERLGVAGRIRFLGFREDVPRVMEALDLFVLPSISDGMPTAVMEAAAMGLPIVATRTGGVPEMIEHERTGLLVECADARGLAEAVARMRSEPDLARECAARAREMAHDRFQSDRVPRATEAFYQSLLGSARPA